MGGGPADAGVAARAVGFGLPLAVVTAWVLGALSLSRPAHPERAGASAAGAAAGRDGLAAADHLRHPRPDRLAAE